LRYLILGALLLTACPKPEPTPTPTPGPLPECSCSLPPDDSNWQGTTVATPLGEAPIRIARDVVGPCTAVPEDDLRALAAQLRAQNVCAVQHTDAVYISRPDDIWEEWHARSYAACWASLSTAYKGSWTIPGSQGCIK
jgi:hypothetical protein